MVLFALGVANTLDLGVVMTMGLSCPSARLRPGRATGEVGLSLATRAPEVGAGCELVTEHFVKGEKANLLTLKASILGKERPVPGLFSLAQRQRLGGAKIIQQHNRRKDVGGCFSQRMMS